MPFLSFIEPIFAWNVPLVFLIFLKQSLVFPILLFSSISLHWSLRMAFLSLLAILWNSAMVFPMVMYGCESWTVKKAEGRKLMLLNCGVREDSWESLGLQGDPTSPFWRRLALGFLWREWCWSWNSSTLATSCEKSWLIGKDSDAGRDWGQEEKGMTEDEMAGWHPWLNGHESEWTLGADDGHGGLLCCNSWSHKESDMTEQLNWTELMKVKKASEKVGLKLQTFRKLRSWHLVPSLHGKYMGKQWQTLFSYGPTSLQIVTAAMKLKGTCSLEEKLWLT